MSEEKSNDTLTNLSILALIIGVYLILSAIVHYFSRSIWTKVLGCLTAAGVELFGILAGLNALKFPFFSKSFQESQPAFKTGLIIFCALYVLSLVIAIVEACSKDRVTEE